MRRCRIVRFVAWFGILAGVWAPAAARADHIRVAAKIDALLAAPDLKGGIQGVIVQAARDGATWYEHDADLYLMPASNQKLLTSAAALALLGPDFRYRTRLLRTGMLGPGGVLDGDLVIGGSGDPILADKDLDAFVTAVKKAGIVRVTGRVLGDGSRFASDRLGDGWSWDYLSDYYAAPSSGLNLNENVVRVTVDPAPAAGEPPRVSISPADSGITVTVRGKTATKGTKPSLNVFRELGRNSIVIEGDLPVDAKAQDHRPVAVTVERPPLYAASVLAGMLARAGIRVDGGADTVGGPPTGAVELAVHSSPPMSDLLLLLNKPSDNLIAECLLKTLGSEKGSGGSAGAGRVVAEAWFKSRKLDPAGVRMADGSGLSRLNYVTPRFLVGLLRAMSAHPQGKAYIDSLPVAGVDGSLRDRMKGTPAEKNCRAKTGYIGSVSSLSGYVKTADGQDLVFVILMNNHRCANSVAKGIQDRIVECLAGYKENP